MRKLEEKVRQRAHMHSGSTTPLGAGANFDVTSNAAVSDFVPFRKERDSMGHLLFLEDRGSPKWKRKSKWFNSSAQSIRYLDEDEGLAR